MKDVEVQRILHDVRDKYARAGRGDADIFRKLENRLVPLALGEAVQFQALGNRRWLNGAYAGPVENPDDPHREGDVYVRSSSGKRVAVFLSSVQRRATQDEPDTPEPHTTELNDRWYIVVIRERDGALNAISRRLPGLDGKPFSGPWALLTSTEAEALVNTYNTIEDNSVAEAVEVFRYDHDPEWPEQYT